MMDSTESLEKVDEWDESSAETSDSEDEDEVIMIPVQGDDAFVKVSVSELPDDASVILDILKVEHAPLDLWMKFAVQYFKQGKIEPFLYILDQGSQTESDRGYIGKESDSSRVAMLDALAAYYVGLASKEKDPSKRDEYFQKATMNYNKSDKIDIEDERTWVGKGMLLLCKGDRNRANDYFDTVLERNKHNLPAMLGKACIAFNKKEYENALELYKQVVKIHPGCPANVRVGIALCFFWLRREDLAQRAFERVLQMDPSNVHALVGKAILKLNSDEDGSIHSAMELLKRGYHADSTNAMVLNHLCSHFFFKGDYQRVQQLAQTATQHTKVREMQAESLYHIARSFHAQDEFENAFQYYYRAAKMWKELDVAQFGLAQMLIYKGRHEEAIGLLEAVLKKYPENYECIRTLASAYASKGMGDKALAAFKKATNAHPEDVNGWLEYAQLLEGLQKYSAALDANTKAAQLIMRKDGDGAGQGDEKEEMGDGDDDDEDDDDARAARVKPELWNNIGVLRHKTGDLSGARVAYHNALKQQCGRSGGPSPASSCYQSLLDVLDAMDTTSSGDDEAVVNAQEKTIEFKAEDVTVLYNLAVLEEDAAHYHRAEAIHRAILSKVPKYMDSILRLGKISIAMGDRELAKSRYTDAFDHDKECISAWCLLGSLHLDAKEWLSAQKQFEKVLHCKNGKHDAYAMLQLGHMYYQSSFEHHSTEKKKKYIRSSKNFYAQVLDRDPHNLYAANGVGTILAEKGFLQAAKDIFLRVREASTLHAGTDMPDVLVNLAHTYLAEGQYVNAVKMYQKALEDPSCANDVQIMTFLAKAYYEHGKHQQAAQVLQRLVDLQPDVLVHQFNLALTKKDHSLMVLRGARPTLAQVEAAVQALEASLATMERLGRAKEAEHVEEGKEDSLATTGVAGVDDRSRPIGYHPSVAMQHAENVRSHLSAAQEQLRAAREQHSVLKAQREAQVEAARRAREEQQRREAIEAEAERKRQEELEAAARESQERLSKFREEWNAIESEKAREGSRGKRNKGDAVLGKSRYASGSSEGSEEYVEGDEANGRKKKRRKKKSNKPRERYASGDEDDDVVEEPIDYSEDWKAMRDKRNPMAKALAEKVRLEKEEEKQKAIRAIKMIHADNQGDDVEIVTGKRKRHPVAQEETPEDTLAGLLDDGQHMMDEDEEEDGDWGGGNGGGEAPMDDGDESAQDEVVAQ